MNKCDSTCLAWAFRSEASLQRATFSINWISNFFSSLASELKVLAFLKPSERPLTWPPGSTHAWQLLVPWLHEAPTDLPSLLSARNLPTQSSWPTPLQLLTLLQCSLLTLDVVAWFWNNLLFAWLKNFSDTTPLNNPYILFPNSDPEACHLLTPLILRPLTLCHIHRGRCYFPRVVCDSDRFQLWSDGGGLGVDLW